MTGTPKSRPYVPKEDVVFIGNVLRRCREACGWDRDRLCRATGYSRTFVGNCEAGNVVGRPSRLALRFMLDTVGADLDTPDVKRALSLCADRAQRTEKVATRMEAFYARHPGGRPAELESLRPPRAIVVQQVGSSVVVPPAHVLVEGRPAYSWASDYGGVTSQARASRLEEMTADLMRLAADRLDTPDVARWLESNVDALTTDERMNLIRILSQ